MASGDVVNYVANLLSAQLVYFVPAAGVEIAILTQGSQRANGYVGMTDGVLASTHWYAQTVNSTPVNGHKLMINNTNHLLTANYDALTGVVSWSGIQIK
jgi:hypothetical protein